MFFCWERQKTPFWTLPLDLDVRRIASIAVKEDMMFSVIGRIGRLSARYMMQSIGMIGIYQTIRWHRVVSTTIPASCEA